MLITDLREGTKLEVKIYDDSGQKVKLTCVSEFQWAEDDQTAVIAAPISEGIIYPVHKNTLVRAYFVDNISSYYNASLYTFKAKVLDRNINDNIELIRIKVEGDIQRIQRRQFFRFECTVPVSYRVIQSLNPIKYKEMECKETVSKDLSGGGLCIKLTEELNKDELLECELKLGEELKINFIGKVIRLTKYDSQGKYKYEAGVEFQRIHDKDRDAVIKYIFEQQRKLRKKGLI